MYDTPDMSKPRQIIPGSIYLVSRRTQRREYRLKPTPILEQIFCYCLAYAASLYKIQIHAYCVMSNHYHLVVTDPYGLLPDFMSWLNEFVAKVLNVVTSEWESLWSSGTYSAVRLETPEDVYDKIIYTLTNPVKSFLVADARNWPGATSATVAFDSPKKYRRPGIFFRKDGPLPEEATLCLTVPKCLDVSASEFKTELNLRMKQVQQDFQNLATQQNRKFLGVEGIRKIRITDRPKSKALHRNLNPHVASRNATALRNAMLRLKLFRAEYADARHRFDRGERDVVFPFGTYGLRKTVTVQSIPPPDILLS